MEPETKEQGSTCEEKSWVNAAPNTAERVEVPVPLTTAPKEEADVEAAVPAAAAVNRPPKEDVLTFPLLWDEVRVREQVIEHICIQHRLFRQCLVELVAPDYAALLEPVKVQPDEGGVPFDHASPAVLLDRPAVRDERIDIAVDDVLGGHDFGVTESHTAHLGDVVTGREPVNISQVGNTIALQGILEFAGQFDTKSKFSTHY